MEHLIPQEWFAGMSQPALLVVTVVALAVVGKGADWLVDGACAVAYRFGVSKVIIGATIVSIGTTSPEAVVSVMAAWSGEPGLALGNAVGSVIADTGLIFGLGCLLARLPADRFILERQGWVQFGSAALLASLCYYAYWRYGGEASLSRVVGLFLLVLFVLYVFVSIRWTKRHGGEGGEGPDEFGKRHGLLASVALGVGGLALVIVVSRVLILSVTELAENHWNVPKVVIAGTLVALGTSMPELIIGVASILKGHKELLVGNVIGADILNVLFVIGASAVAAPLPLIESGARVPDIAFRVHLPTMILVLLLFRIFIFQSSRRGYFRRWYGIPLVLIYVFYVQFQFLIS